MSNRISDEDIEANRKTSRASIQLVEICSSPDLDRFLRFPWKIYRSDPNWVPLLLSEQRDSLGSDSLFHEHGRFQLWLAERDGEVVGRIGAFIDDLLPEDGVGNVGFFEAIDDDSVARALFDEAEKWLADNGVKRIRGPISATLHEIVGAYIEGEAALVFSILVINHFKYMPSAILAIYYKNCMK